MQRETAFKNKIRPFLDKLGFCEKIQQVGIGGTPDFLVCISGHFIAIELKKDRSSKASKLQVYKLHQVYNAGGIGLIVSPENWEETHDKLESLAHGENASYHRLRAISRRHIYGRTGSAGLAQIQKSEDDVSGDEAN